VEVQFNRPVSSYHYHKEYYYYIYLFQLINYFINFRVRIRTLNSHQSDPKLKEISCRPKRDVSCNNSVIDDNYIGVEVGNKNVRKEYNTR